MYVCTRRFAMQTKFRLVRLLKTKKTRISQSEHVPANVGHSKHQMPPHQLTPTPGQWPDVEKEMVILDSLGKQCSFQYLCQVRENNYLLQSSLSFSAGGVLGLDEYLIKLLEHVEKEGVRI